jgi:four helix bundle protein
MGRSYEDLLVWQRSVDFSVEIYAVTAGFPKYELYGMTSQLRRAALSVPSNIAEGQARRTRADFKHFLAIARGSLMEVETQLFIACRLGYLTKEGLSSLRGKSSEIGRLVNGLMNSL